MGESSGATSYHLRQLDKHDFVREIEGRGSARERWWERTPGSLSIHSQELGDDPATKDALRMVNRQFGHSRAQLLEDFMEHGDNLLPPEWSEGSNISTMNTRLTAAELTELSNDLHSYARELFDQYRHRNDNNPNARAVQIHINAFPNPAGPVFGTRHGRERGKKNDCNHKLSINGETRWLRSATDHRWPLPDHGRGAACCGTSTQPRSLRTARGAVARPDGDAPLGALELIS